MAQRRSARARRPRRRRSARGASPELQLLIFGAAAIAVLAWALAPRLSRTADHAHDRRSPALSMADARRSNAMVPIVDRVRRPAPPFRFRGGIAAREQATECLATAALYEAGDDRDGQRAVIQVVLNRVGKPGFPATVCGVVYQGAGRATGCQFSFTCDGSQARRPEHTGWAQARRFAKRALGGYVYARVGRATHYHADWMVPYWRPSLDKVAQVRSHIFYQRH
jgi:spore germination cell wall hydrolase CwlJ-like protein